MGHGGRSAAVAWTGWSYWSRSAKHATQALIPYNVNTQQTRTRYWNGHDNMFRDDVTWLHGKHLIQFGGMYQNNYDQHQRTDNGGGINYQTVYQLGTTRRRRNRAST